MTIEGLDDALGNLRTLASALEGNLDGVILEELRRTQREAADLVPVDTGRGRETILLDEAIGQSTDADGRKVFEFGFRTLNMQRRAFYLFFVEFGTQARAAGGLINPGVGDRRSRSGRRRRARRRKRSSPARPAQPFFRPAIENLMRRLEQTEAFTAIVRGLRDSLPSQ